MAAPTNTAATTATDLGTLPATVTQDVHDAGTTYTVWYKFTAPADSVVIGAWGFGDLVTYKPTLRPYTGPAGAPVQILSISSENKPIQFPVTAGVEYFLEFTTNAGNPSPASLAVSVLAAPNDAPQPGDFLAIADKAGHPSAVYAPGVDWDVRRFVSFPIDSSASSTAVLTDGTILGYDEANNRLSLHSSDFTFLLSPSITLAGGVFPIISAQRVANTFYVAKTSNPSPVYAVSSDGTVQTKASAIPFAMESCCANSDGTILYYSRVQFGTAIKQWDLVNDVALSDFAAGITGYRVSDILALDDGSVLVGYWSLGSIVANDFFVRKYSSSGSTLQTYAFGTTNNAGTAPRITYGGTFSSEFGVWLHEKIVPNEGNHGISHFLTVRISDGATINERQSAEFDEFAGANNDGMYGYNSTATPLARFGNANSCYFLVLPEAPIVVTPPTTPTQTPTATTGSDCPCPPADGGPSSGGPSGPSGTGPIGGGGSGKSGPNEGGSGWTPDALCDGGGTVNSYPVASAGESMVGVREPRVWADVAFVEFAADDTETAASVYWSLHVPMPDLPSAYGGRKDGRALGISRISRGMSDDNGNYSGSKVTVDVKDKDRAALRTRLGGATTKYVWEREGVIRIASEANRRSAYATAPRELYRGVTHDVQIDKRFTGSLSFEDKLCSQFGRFGPDRSFSSRLLTLGMLPACPREIVGKPQQWIFGEVSDEGATDPATGAAASKGLVPIWLVGSDATSDHYHLAAHEIGALTLYGSDGGDPATRVLLSEGSDYTVEVLNLLDSETGLTHRVTHILCPIGSVYSEAHKAGRLNMAANVCGVLGANGLVIKDLFKIYQYIFEHLVLPEQESLTGEYVGAPQWADGRYMVHSDSFDQAQDFSITRIGGAGYQGGFVLGGPGQGAVTLRELLRRMSNSGDCWFTWTAAGQLKVLLLDDAQNVDGVDILTEPAGLRALPTPEFAFDEVENPVLFSYDYDDDKKKFRVAQEKVESADAITRMGRPRPSPSPIQMRCIRDPDTARDVAARRLLRRQYPPAYYPIVEPLDGLDRDPGDVVKVTSQEGVGDGCDERPMWIKETSCNLKTMRVTHLCRDLTDILGTAAFWGPDGLTTYDTEDASDQLDYAFWADEDDLVGAVAAKGWS